jgi:hypothetical protein
MEKDEREITLRQDALKRLMDAVETEQTIQRSEKKMLMIIGVLVVGLVASVGLAMFMKSPKEQDIARQRCEMDHSVSLVWKETDALKAANPGIDAKALRDRVEAKRAEFKDQARAYCATK